MISNLGIQVKQDNKESFAFKAHIDPNSTNER